MHSTTTTTTSIFLNPSSIFPPKPLLYPLNSLQFLPRSNHHKPPMASCGRLTVTAQAGRSLGGDGEVRTLIDYVGKSGINVGNDLVVLIHHIQYACKRIASLVASPFNSNLGNFVAVADSGGGSDRDAPKPLDILSVGYSAKLDFN
ncbi:hypothetical protein Dimus_002994 [Dionaea muscipula]